MISARVRQFLDQNGVRYDVLRHDPAFTAQELAAGMHVPGREFVKVVVVKLDGRYALVALPAHRRVDLKELAAVAAAKKCSLATEEEFQKLFPDCEVGAMPPFGNLYKMDTFVDREVTRDERIVVNAGTHAEAVRLRYADLERLVMPHLGSFGVPPPAERAAKAGSVTKKAKKKAKRRKKAPARKKPKSRKKKKKKKK